MKKLMMLLVIAGMLIGAGGCGYYENLRIERREKDKEYFISQIPDIDATTLEKILNHKITIGMTKQLVKFSWGNPRDINRTVSSWGIREQWVYGDWPDNYRLLYFRDGILTSWQD